MRKPRTPATVACLPRAFGPAAHAAGLDRIVLPAGVTPNHYELAVVPDAAHMSFTGAVKIDLDVAQPTDRIELNAADLKFTAVSLSGSGRRPQ